MNTKASEPDLIALVDNLIRTIMSKSMSSPSSKLDLVDKRQSRYAPSSMGVGGFYFIFEWCCSALALGLATLQNL